MKDGLIKTVILELKEAKRICEEYNGYTPCKNCDTDFDYCIKLLQKALNTKDDDN